MTTVTISTINKAVQDAHEWLKDLAARGGFANEEQAYSGLRAVLHALRDRLTVDEAVDVSAQLPLFVRGVYFEGWRPSLAPNAEKTKAEFFASVEDSLRNASERIDVQQATHSVFGLLVERLDEGQIRHIKSVLPKEIEELWS